MYREVVNIRFQMIQQGHGVAHQPGSSASKRSEHAGRTHQNRVAKLRRRSLFVDLDDLGIMAVQMHRRAGWEFATRVSSTRSPSANQQRRGHLGPRHIVEIDETKVCYVASQVRVYASGFASARGKCGGLGGACPSDPGTGREDGAVAPSQMMRTPALCAPAATTMPVRPRPP